MLVGLYPLDNFAPNLISPADGWFQYRYIVEDTDFIEEWVGPCKQRLNYSDVRCGAIIRCYEAKKDNVAFQLSLYHKYMIKTHKWYKLEDEIRYNIEHTPMYGEYAPVVRDYLKRIDSLKAFW
jgi:hypothetical protein